MTPQINRIGFFWATSGVGLATAGFWAVRSYLDKGQASLLYLPVVIACAIRFGFGPAVLGAVLSFLCWDFFFLPPFGTFLVSDPKDWLSLLVFLLAAVTTAQLASQARTQTQQARAREAEIGLLFQASETLSREVRADALLAALARQLQEICQISRCRVFRRDAGGMLHLAAGQDRGPDVSDEEAETISQMAEVACEHHKPIGFGPGRTLWAKALGAARSATGEESAVKLGAAIPLQAEDALVGVLYVGPRRDGQPFSDRDERLILTLANHAAVVIARETLAGQAAQAQALRESDALKDSLLSLVSHELRTPLAAIKASASGLLQPDSAWAEADRRDALSAINTEADRLGHLVSNLLDLSRIEAGAWRPSKDWCDLGEIVGTALDRLAEADAARVLAEIGPDLPLVRVDYLQITLVVTNLLENAVKYAGAASPIHLHAFLAPDSGEEKVAGITLTVRDFGAGLMPGEEMRLFDRFYRGRAHVGSILRGTGLGLALCRAIVEAHGGTIRAANALSGEPRGAVFTMFLPLGEKP